MPDREKVIKGLEAISDYFFDIFRNDTDSYKCEKAQEYSDVAIDALALLKEQEELLRKLQKDKDKLCLEISGWKHKFHDAPPKFVSQGVVDQICWERDTALSQLEEIGKGLGSKMDDIVALLKEQEVKTGHWIDTTNTIGFPRCKCSECNSEAGAIWMKYCPNCGAKMEGR